MPDITFPGIFVLTVLLVTLIFLVWTKRFKLTVQNTIFFILFFGVFYSVVIAVKISREERKKEYVEFFDNFNVSFKGQVGWYREYKGYPDLQKGAGPKFNLYYLKVLQSSVVNYDPSDTTDDFYCIIRDSVAMVVEETMRKNILIKDILQYDGKKDIMYHLRIKKKYKKKIWKENMVEQI